MYYWPEVTAAIEAPARRVDYSLRDRIDAIMAFIRPPQKMSIELARVALREVGAPHPVIERLLGGLVEYRS